MTVCSAPRSSRLLFGSSFRAALPLLAGLLLAAAAPAAEVVPPAVHLPGTQPGETSQIESVGRCDNCHGGYDRSAEPFFNWQGSMMSHASRDPLFWATVAVAEQDFDGSGDLCIRCHTPEGWLAGRSTPTDGSGLSEDDSDGVQCDVCHRLTNPDGSEHVGVQNDPFLAHDEGTPPEGYYGAGEYVIWDENSKLGPYDQTAARHQFLASDFHRDSALCGTCHDVSNPVTGDLAPNNGAQDPLETGTFSGDPSSPLDAKAAFNNFPHAYGVVERTYSEHQASAFADLLVSDYGTLPSELQGGAIEQAWQAAQAVGNGGDYADGTPRSFSCQTCHMRPVSGAGCDKKDAPLRDDLPLHDLTGGNYWTPEAIRWQDERGLLRLGGGLEAVQLDALDAGALRARENLSNAAALRLSGNQVRVVNRTGHKLISGYPEGRRMWLEVRWLDSGGALLAEDGAYGALPVQHEGQSLQVESLLDLHPPYTPIYEAHGALTQPWAARLLDLGLPPELSLAFDREEGGIETTLGELAARAEDAHEESFHFVLNNAVVKDNRIPPYGMGYDAAVERNILPVPPEQYGDPGPGGTYAHWDAVPLNPPAGAASAEIRLRYQPTSWEYVQFLALANEGSNAFLGDEGRNLLDAWLATGMAAPHTMATATWSADATAPACSDGLDNDGDGATDYDADPGCSSTEDASENDAGLPCDNRVDDDGDGWTDAVQDPGCRDADHHTESPACEDDLDNDGDGYVDWDGGGVGDPDPQCSAAWDDREARSTCGLGYELPLALLALLGLRARRRRAA